MKISKTDSVRTITMSTRDKKDLKQQFAWWEAKSDKDLAMQLIATAAFLKESQNFRYRNASMFAKLYGNQSLFNSIGTSLNKLDSTAGLPLDRPTFNLVQSAVDTLVSRISQNRPAPCFLTDNGDYKERNLAKKLNNFIQGEFYSTKTYEKTATMLRDALVEGTGVLHVYRSQDNKVGVERVLLTELNTDPNESLYGEPRSLYRSKLIDRKVLMAANPKFKKVIADAETAYTDNSAESSKTVADMVLVIEGWHLPSGKDSGDGRHTLACSAGVIYDEKWEKDKFPFVFLHFSTRLLGFWAQGLAEQLMGTQIEINQLLHTISKAIRLVGVPRVFVENGSKVVKSHNNNDIGVIITYSGTKPSYEVAPCVPEEMYAQLQRLIEYGYQQSGVSALQASSTKPAGLNSGEAIRSYDDISTDRFAALSRKYDTVFIDLAYLIVDFAKDIAEETGEYTTVYPGKNGTKAIDLPEMSILQNPFIIQCFNMSSLPKDPSGRMAKITEMIQGGMISVKEGRRLLDYPDLEQIEVLANASEERIFQILDKIIEDGDYTPPDQFMDLALASELTVQYINLYTAAKLEPEKAKQLRDFYGQIQTLKTAAMPPAPMAAAPGAAMPAAAAQAVPSSPLVPNGSPAGAM